MSLLAMHCRSMRVRTGTRMRRIVSTAAVALAAISIATSPVTAQIKRNTFVAKFKDWEVHKARVGAATVCYAATLPKSRKGKYTRRDETSLLVSFWPSRNVRGQVEIRAGYTYKPDSVVTLEFNNGTKFKLNTKADSAWGVDASDDSKIVTNLSDRVRLKVYGRSIRGTQTVDTYSLSGFRDAVARAKAACGM